MQGCEHIVEYQLFVGVDIAALTATIAWQAPKQKPGKPLTIEQTPEGFSSLHHRLLRTGAQPDRMLVVMEATGIYWLALATFLARLGYAVSIVNPVQAHHFARVSPQAGPQRMPSMLRRSPNSQLSFSLTCGCLLPQSTRSWSSG